MLELFLSSKKMHPLTIPVKRGIKVEGRRSEAAASLEKMRLLSYERRMVWLTLLF